MHVSDVQVSGTETAIITTPKGDIVVEFYAGDAPNTVASFIELADAGFYNGIKFHRIVPSFVVQGGDPQTRDLSSDAVRDIVARQAQGDYRSGEPMIGTGGPGWTQKAEFNSRLHERGTLAMARSQAVDSAGSQFYICLEPQPRLDGQYTVFGRVVEGMDVVDALEVGDEIVSLTIRR
ncbi:MAG: peptidylprolyl isomerase [Coriobacteriia bacterium]|nr:peptidylprolyl isomerase [Coriobacteriia bacterium]